MTDEVKKVFKEVGIIIDRIDASLEAVDDRYAEWGDLSKDCDAVFDKLKGVDPKHLDVALDNPEAIALLERVVGIRSKLEVLVGMKRPEAKA
jgi:hypothetical protein